MMLQCIICKGKYKLKTVNRILIILGVHDVKLTDIDLYLCDGCGREIYPEKTIERIDKIQQEYMGISHTMLKNPDLELIRK